jgi:hypothetical protein
MESGGVIPILVESDRKTSVSPQASIGTLGVTGLASGTWPRGAVERERNSADRKQSFVQTLAEAFGELDSLFVAQQPDNIPQAVVHSPAMITGLKVLLDPKSKLRREIALQVIGQLPAGLIAIDFYDTWFV